MSGMKNNVVLIGNLGADPEFSTLTNGGKLIRMNIATNENYRDKAGEWVTKTEWHRCIAWGGLAERMRDRLSKGKKIALSGKLTYRNYEDKEGKNRRSPQVEISEFTILEKNRQAS